MTDDLALLLQRLTGYCVYGSDALHSGRLLLWAIVSIPFMCACPILFSLVCSNPPIIILLLLASVLVFAWIYASEYIVNN